MRDVKFRGFQIAENKWLYGSLINNLWLDINKKPTFEIIDNSMNYDCYQDFDNHNINVEEDSIGEFANKSDNFGVEIYGGDIVEIDRHNKKLRGEVKQFEGGQWYINHPIVNEKYMYQIHCEVCETDSPAFFLHFFDSYELEIVGNIYENPELI